MTDHAVRKGAILKGSIGLSLALLLAGCGGSQPSNASIDEKLAAAEKAAERAEKAQKAAEEAVRSLAGSGAQISYDEALDADERASRDDGEDGPSFARREGDENLSGSRINSDGVEDLAIPQG